MRSKLVYRLQSTVQRILKRFTANCEPITLNQGGFTLVEMLVVLAVLGITLGLSYPAYKNFQNQSLVDNFAKEVVQIFRQVQNNAVATLHPTCRDYSFIPFKAFDAWVIIFSADRLEVTKACVGELSRQDIKYFEIALRYNEPVSTHLFPQGITTDAYQPLGQFAEGPVGFGKAYCFLTPFGQPSVQQKTVIISGATWSGQLCKLVALPSFNESITISHTSGKQRKVCLAQTTFYEIPASQTC